jgi:hypothetical protein
VGNSDCKAFLVAPLSGVPISLMRQYRYRKNGDDVDYLHLLLVVVVMTWRYSALSCWQCVVQRA